MSSHSIEFEHIVKSYNDKLVIHDLSLALPAAATTAIVGESGSGKSTLLQLVNGLILPDSGTVRVHGELLDYSRLTTQRRSMGYAVQERDCSPTYSSGKCGSGGQNGRMVCPKDQ